jgi:hemolysin III
VQVSVEVASPAMNRRAELAADAIVHAIGIAAALVGAAALIVIAAIKRNGLELVTVTAYSAGLLAMLICSTVYNMAERSPYRELLRRFDHAAIFVMIAGTYTPFTALALRGGWAVAMTVFIWVVAVFGVVLKLSVSSERFAKLSMALYLTFGWIGMVIMWPLLGAVGVPILILLAVGGVIYSLGTIVHALDRLPFQRAIWHGLVVTAAAVHYAAIVALVHG